MVEILDEKKVDDRSDEGEGWRGTIIDTLKSFNVETHGIDRVPVEERESTHMAGLFFLWFSAVITLTCMPFGMLGYQAFSLSFSHTTATALGFTAIGCACVSFIATLGPQLGMRTMVLTRYSYGYYGSILVSFLNVLTQLGFSVIAVILAGQTLNHINPNLPLAVGVVIVGVGSVLVCFFGYNLLHHYERYAWMMMVTIFMMCLGLASKKGFDLKHQQEVEVPSGASRAASVLSYGSIMFSAPGSLAPIAADFNCRLPSNTSKTKIFSLTFLGLFISFTTITIWGAILVTVREYSDAYVNDGGPAAVLNKVFEPWKKGGDFILVLITLSAVGNNIPNTYSSGISIQTLLPVFRKVPRPVFTVAAFIIYTVIGVVGRDHITDILNNFLAILAYWLGFWFTIVFEEHVIFRWKTGPLGGYDLEAYADAKRLPPGIAAVTTSLCSVAGAVLGMAQVWYVGPIAAKVGPLGGDVGFELAAVMAAVLYPPLRYCEIKMFGR